MDQEMGESTQGRGSTPLTQAVDQGAGHSIQLKVQSTPILNDVIVKVELPWMVKEEPQVQGEPSSAVDYSGRSVPSRHVCPHCSTVFMLPSSLQVHLETFHGWTQHSELPGASSHHVCPHCSTVFMLPSGLHEHLKTFHGQEQHSELPVALNLLKYEKEDEDTDQIPSGKEQTLPQRTDHPTEKSGTSAVDVVRIPSRPDQTLPQRTDHPTEKSGTSAVDVVRIPSGKEQTLPQRTDHPTEKSGTSAVDVVRTVEIPAHSLREHTRRVNSLCRICGGRVLRTAKDKRKKAVPCSSYTAEFLEYYNLDLSSDEEGKHSKNICVKCSVKVAQLIKRSHCCKLAIVLAVQSMDKMSRIWATFSQGLSLSQCTVCSYFQLQSHGGRPRKKSKFAKDSDRSDLSLTIDSNVSASHCQSTSSPVKKPRTLNTQTSPVSLKTPVTDSPLSPFPQLKHRTVFSDSDAEDIDKPLSEEEENILTRLVLRKLRQSSDKMTVRCKTRGEPIVLKKVAQPGKSCRAAPWPEKHKQCYNDAEKKTEHVGEQ